MASYAWLHPINRTTTLLAESAAVPTKILANVLRNNGVSLRGGVLAPDETTTTVGYCSPAISTKTGASVHRLLRSHFATLQLAECYTLLHNLSCGRVARNSLGRSLDLMRLR
jgi:hypothetical protein